MKTYTLKFGTGDPRPFTGLSPSMILFYNAVTGATSLGPTIIEQYSGSGLYQFTYGPTTPIVFLSDGGPNLSASDRYLAGTLDPIQSVDEKVGTVQDSFGSSSVDPSTLIGWAKRAQEFNEGNAVFTKATGIWDVYSRGSSTLIAEKALTNTISQATKS